MSAPSPCFALVDCNSFYASCEKLFRPDLAQRPVVVLSNNDGCIVARSAEAKALGIKMAVPAYQVKPLLEREQVAVFSSNYALYADISNRVMSTLETLAPAVEVYSIDEAFLDFAGMEASHDLLEAWL
jgi:DNA polymerase V